MAKGIGPRDYAAGKTTYAVLKWPDETILPNRRNDAETDAP
ncbi:hypothetical protein ABID58_002379 [Bradyrhizobium sp. S3.2.6]